MSEERDARYNSNMDRFAQTGDSADLDPGIGFGRRRDRLISEILGMFRMSLHDGVISESEAKTMHDWIVANPDTAYVYPVKQLRERLDRAFANGRLEPEEQADLNRFAALLLPDIETHHPLPAATKLPLDDPRPSLSFVSQQYVFTGTFLSGTRKWCEEQVRARGGVCKSKVVQTMNVLVIGELGSHQWTQSTHGRKIEEVMRLKASGFPILVVDEAHFVSFL
jgi:NAD-dependent DNA ligase